MNKDRDKKATPKPRRPWGGALILKNDERLLNNTVNHGRCSQEIVGSYRTCVVTVGTHRWIVCITR